MRSIPPISVSFTHPRRIYYIRLFYALYARPVNPRAFLFFSIDALIRWLLEKISAEGFPARTVKPWLPLPSRPAPHAHRDQPQENASRPPFVASVNTNPTKPAFCDPAHAFFTDRNGNPQGTHTGNASRLFYGLGSFQNGERKRNGERETPAP